MCETQESYHSCQEFSVGDFQIIEFYCVSKKFTFLDIGVANEKIFIASNSPAALARAGIDELFIFARGRRPKMKS